VILAWPRAILLQLAHPLIAAGVANHSTFRGSGLAALRRLHHTVRAMRVLTFGDAARAERVLTDIRAIHSRVHGALAEAVGPFPAGTRYSAEDPDLLLWVHATLLESLPLIYSRLVAPLSTGDLDAYCEETAWVAVALGARDAAVPRTWLALTAYLESVNASGVLTVGAQARMLSHAVLHPRLPMARPMLALTRAITLGTLPAPVRRQYGYAWGEKDNERLSHLMRRLRAARRAAPRVLALWAEARRAR
jgi:uncharacterized protein (DUF2236 family)